MAYRLVMALSDAVPAPPRNASPVGRRSSAGSGEDGAGLGGRPAARLPRRRLAGCADAGAGLAAVGPPARPLGGRTSILWGEVCGHAWMAGDGSRGDWGCSHSVLRAGRSHPRGGDSAGAVGRDVAAGLQLVQLGVARRLRQRLRLRQIGVGRVGDVQLGGGLLGRWCNTHFEIAQLRPTSPVHKPPRTEHPTPPRASVWLNGAAPKQGEERGDGKRRQAAQRRRRSPPGDGERAHGCSWCP